MMVAKDVFADAMFYNAEEIPSPGPGWDNRNYHQMPTGTDPPDNHILAGLGPAVKKAGDEHAQNGSGDKPF